MAVGATHQAEEQSLPSPMNKQNRKLQRTGQRISTFSDASATGKKKKPAGVFLAFLLSSDMSKLPLAT